MAIFVPATRWKLLAFVLLFAFNLITFAAIQASANRRIEENTRQINDIVAAELLAHASAPAAVHRWESMADRSSSPIVGGRGATVDAGGSGGVNSRNVQLSIMTLQKQLAAVKSLAERNSQEAAAKEAKLRSLEAAGRQLAQLLPNEANLTLCAEQAVSQQQQPLVSPAEGIFRVELSGRVRATSVYANMKLFELRKNGSPLKNGGVIRYVLCTLYWLYLA